MSSFVEKKNVSQEILRYLLRHPDAQDTLEGISEWWLFEERIIRKYAEVESALADLIKLGFVLEKPITNVGTFYCLNQVKRNEIRQLIERT